MSVLPPPGEGTALTINAHQRVEILAMKTFGSCAIFQGVIQGVIFLVNAVLEQVLEGTSS
jgi:hypothetical protein